MSEFSNVSVVKKANIYFDGKVASHTVMFPDGSKKTLGIMQSGDYEFSTGAAEVMEILSGELDWQMKGDRWLEENRGWRVVQCPGQFGLSYEGNYSNGLLLFVYKLTSFRHYPH